MAEDEDVGFEEGMLWLPTHVLNEACEDSKMQEHLRHQRHHRQHQHGLNSPVSEPLHPLYSKSGFKPRQRPRFPTNCGAAGGPGMQAIFLDSGQRSCGAGVFLPRRAGTHEFQSNNKPACSPVLLPSRVVQALNLNVHELNSQIKPNRDLKNNSKGVERNSVGNKKGNKVASQYCVIPQSRNSSPEIFLPKEWTY